jgi:uncharacterized membrane protein
MLLRAQTFVTGLALLACSTSLARAQSLNLDYGSAFGTPASSYGAAANQSGHWNALDSNGPPFPLLRDVGGKATRVRIHQQLPFGPASFDDPDTFGDDEALMDDYLDLHSTPHTFVLTGLEPGNYSIYTYGWAPDSASFSTVVEVEGLGPQFVGGAWPGAHKQGVTFAKHDVVVKQGQRIGVFTFGLTKGTLNGFQFVRHPSPPANGVAFVPLGNLDPTAKPAGSLATGISSDGSIVVGTSFFYDGAMTQTRACRWKLDEGTKNLGVPPLSLDASAATSVSDDGSVVGGAIGFVLGGVLEIRNGALWTGLDRDAAASVFDIALTVNDVSADGSIRVGATRLPGFWPIVDSAFYSTDQTKGPVPLGYLPGGSTSYAEAISGDGRVIVGWADGVDHLTAVRWTRTTGLVPLAGLPDLPGQANGVSFDGEHIVGRVGADAFRWSAPDSVVLIPSANGVEASANDVSADGSVVVGATDQAFVWDAAHGLRNLRDVLESSGLDLSEWTLLSATAVSDDGRRVCGVGVNPAGDLEAFFARLAD